MRDRTITTALLGALLFIFTACGGRLYRVAPLPATAPPEIATNNGKGVNLGAVALGGDQSYERFEANLPLAGVIAVELRMVNKSDATIKLAALKFQLRDQAGAVLKRLSPRQALGSVMKYYENQYYAKAAYQRTLEEFESVSLKQAGDLEPEGELRGIVFFRTKRETASVDGLTLSISGSAAGLAEPLTLQLPAARETSGLR
jgi:hypothetical protein